MVQMMRAVDVRPCGGMDGLYINSDIIKPVPNSEQCLVRVKSFGLNRGDTLQREGRYPPPPGISLTMGLEFAGIVESVGESQGESSAQPEEWKEGDEVFGLLYGGGYAEFVVVHKRMLIRKPKELSWEVCGGLCEVWFTALQALHLVAAYDPARTKSILWHAGGSAVSIAGIQLSLAAHDFYEAQSDSIGPAKVFATARTQEKCDICVQQLNCTGAINTVTSPNWDTDIRNSNDGDIDIIFDFVGAPYFQSNLNLLARDGVLVSLGLMGGPIVPEPVDISPIVLKRARFEGSTLRSRSLEYQIKLRDLFVEKVLQGFLDGRFQHIVDTVLPWEDISKGHKLLETNKNMGKIVCTINR